MLSLVATRAINRWQHPRRVCLLLSGEGINTSSAGSIKGYSHFLYRRFSESARQLSVTKPHGREITPCTKSESLASFTATCLLVSAPVVQSHGRCCWDRLSHA